MNPQTTSSVPGGPEQVRRISAQYAVSLGCALVARSAAQRDTTAAELDRQLPAWVEIARHIPVRVLNDLTIAELADDRGWDVHLFNAKEVAGQAAATMGPPWTKDHRVALTATIMAGR